MNLYLDERPFALDAAARAATFGELCRSISDHLSAAGRGIRSVRLDGVEVDCATPPSNQTLVGSRKIEVVSCELGEIAARAVREHAELAGRLAGEFQEFSTDTLLMLPQENFEKWRLFLESLKPLITFIPKFMLLQPLTEVKAPELGEEQLLNRIQRIEEHVNAARRALELQDLVEFSDILELKVVPWLREYHSISEALSEHLAGSRSNLCPGS